MSYVWHSDPDIRDKAVEFLNMYERMEKILVEYCLDNGVQLSIREEKNAGLTLSHGDINNDEYPRGTWITSTQSCN